MLWMWALLSTSWDFEDSDHAVVKSGAQYNHTVLSFLQFKEDWLTMRDMFCKRLAIHGGFVQVHLKWKRSLSLKLWTDEIYTKWRLELHMALFHCFIWNFSSSRSPHTISSHSALLYELCSGLDISTGYGQLGLLSEINWFLCLFSDCWISVQNGEKDQAAPPLSERQKNIYIPHIYVPLMLDGWLPL